MSTKAELRRIRQWEEALVTDYYDYRCQQLLDPLYELFQQWKEGAVSHETVLDAIYQTHKENRERYSFFGQSRASLARFIQVDPWFQPWLENHPAPEGVEILSAALLEGEPSTPPEEETGSAA